MTVAGLELCISLQNMKILYLSHELVSRLLIYVTHTKLNKFNVIEIFEIWLKFMKNLSQNS